MLLLEGQGKAIDNASQDLQQLCDAVVVLRLKHKAVEHIVDGFADEGAVHHELSCRAGAQCSQMEVDGRRVCSSPEEHS